MKKFGKYFILVLLVMFLTLGHINALSSTLGPIKQVGSRVMDSCGSGSCYGLALKVSDSTAVICTDYDKDTPALANGGAGATCSISSDWSEKVRYGVAAIINKAKSNISSTSMTNQYFAAEMAINRFLHNKSAGGAEIAGTALSNTYRSLYISYLDAANAAYDSYGSDSKVEITLSKSSLSFSLSGSNYVSNTITVSGVDSYSVETSVGTVSKSGNSFSISVPAKNIDKTTTVKVTVSSSKSLNQARNYNCGSNYQTITPVALETVKKSDSKSISGTITIEKEDPKAKLTINKVDSNNNHLSGATLKITGPNGYSKTVTSSGSSITISDLELGTYTITETTAPAGYVKAAAQTITFSSSVLTGTVTIKNNKNKVSISKLDVTGTSELPGATLEIQDSSGKTIEKWVSTTTPKIIEGLKVGKYYLIETIAPTGYTLNTEKVEFEITASTTTQTVKMLNKLNSITIQKIDTDTNKAVAGATLEIQDEKGNIVKYCTDAKGNKNTECKWVSTTTAYKINGMPVGKYYLVETAAPTGYTLNSKKVEFEVKSTTETLSVKMNNKKNLIKILKVNSVDKKGLAGAALEVQDENGNIIKYCTDAKGNKNTECKWESTTEPYEISGLPVGKYYLIETKAPAGYELNTKKTEFIVESTSDEIEVILENQLEVEVPDTLSSRSALLLTIAMFDIALGIGIITYVKKNKIEQ